MSLVYVLAGVGFCALVLGAFFLWWFCADCFSVSNETVIVVEDQNSHGSHEIITYEENPAPVEIVVDQYEY